MNNHPETKDNSLDSLSGAASLHIQLTNAGKRFNRDWIFRKLTYRFEQGKSYAITGPNGSGKSTLLQVIAGSTACSEGVLQYKVFDSSQSTVKSPESIVHGEQSGVDNNSEPLPTVNYQLPTNNLTTETIYNHLSIAAPYLEVIEEMTAKEFLEFHSVFKPLSLPIDEIINIVGLEKADGKQIRYYSSGMKQRVKLAQAIFSHTPLLLLDEPCTNLDKNGYQLYHDLIQNYCNHKLIIVSSNDEMEMDFCEEKLSILDWK